MLSKIKNLFSFMYHQEEVEEEEKFIHQEILDELNNIKRKKQLVGLLNRPAVKTYLLVMYTKDINVLAFGNKGDMTVTKKVYSVEEYIKDHVERIGTHLNTIYERVKRCEYDKYQLEDIEEIIRMFNFYFEEYEI